MRKLTGKLGKVFLISFGLCALAYSVLITNECTNVWDGLWAGSIDNGARWVLSIGRWFWPFISWSRLRISTEPFTSLMTIALIVFSGCLILSMFSLTESRAAYFVPLVLGVNVTVCICLSYRFMSPTFGTAILLNVLGIWLLKKKKQWWSWVLATGFFTLGLGCYQAYIGCALVLFLACVIQMLLNREEKRTILIFALRTAAAILLACIVYKILWDVSLAITHIEPAKYRGASSASIGNILTRLPQRIIDAYTDFFAYFAGNSFTHHVFQKIFLYPAAVAAYALLSLIPVVRHFRVSKGGAVIMLVCFLCFPVAANVSLLLAPEAGKTDVLMALPMVMMAPVLLCVCLRNKSRNRLLRWAPLLPLRTMPKSPVVSRTVSLRLRWSVPTLPTTGRRVTTPTVRSPSPMFPECSIEQHTMLHGRESTISFMDRVVANLEANDMIHSENEIIFLGRPSGNPLFNKDDLWELSNERSRYGNLPYNNDSCVMSYLAVARDGGYNLPLAEDSTVWHEIAARPESRAMPVYPAEGYCQIIDGYLVVKLSK